MSKQQVPSGGIRAGVVGATGYTGQELLRLLLAHPAVELAAIASVHRAGQHIADALPQFRGVLDVRFCAPADTADCEVVFFALPHGQAMVHVPGLLQSGTRVIDLSADFRLPEALWRETYGEPHYCPELLAEAVYGLPELHSRRLADARLVANPGCYPTATLLAIAPLLQAQAITPQLVVDAKSGVTGAGRKTSDNLLYAQIDGALQPYGLPRHRHHAEIINGLGESGRGLILTFVPHLVPMKRGLLASIYATLTRETDIQALLEERYAEEPFVHVLPTGASLNTATAVGCNHCLLSVHRVEGSHLVLFSAIDNLVKGAAGQAVQNMNLMFSRPQVEGLAALPWLP